MAKYRIYRTFEMYGYQDIEATTEAEALAHPYITGCDEPEDWEIDGYSSSCDPEFNVYSVDGVRKKC